MKKLLFVVVSSLSIVTTNMRAGEALEGAKCSCPHGQASAQEEQNPPMDLRIEHKTQGQTNLKPHPLAFKAASQVVSKTTSLTTYPTAIHVDGTRKLIECVQSSATPDKVTMTLAVYQKALAKFHDEIKDAKVFAEHEGHWWHLSSEKVQTEWGNPVSIPKHDDIRVTPLKKP